MYNLEEFRTFLDSRPKVVIIPHSKPDADALGSCLAFERFLGKLGLEADVVSPTDYPKFLYWMEGHRDVVHHNGEDKEKARRLVSEAGLVCCLDFSQLSRIDDMEELVRGSTAKKLVIDHHIDPERGFFDFEVHDTKAAATCELVFDLIKLLDKEGLLDKTIGENLYAGIVTDTGSFKHSNVTPKVHRIAADLLELGVDAALVHHYIYDSNSEDRVKFLGFALNERLTILDDYRAAYFAISEEDLKSFNSQTGDTEGVVNYALSISGINLAAMFTERDGDVRMSFRSFGDFSVADLAREHFNGGGHKNAAGGRMRGVKVEEVVETFLKVLPKYREQLISG